MSDVPYHYLFMMFILVVEAWALDDEGRVLEEKICALRRHLTLCAGRTKTFSHVLSRVSKYCPRSIVTLDYN